MRQVKEPLMGTLFGIEIGIILIPLTFIIVMASMVAEARSEVIVGSIILFVLSLGYLII